MVHGASRRNKLRATFDCCHYAISVDAHGNVDIKPGIKAEYPPTGQFELQWLSVPVGTSIVAYEINGEPRAFQQPIGRVASLPLTHEWPFEVAFTAIGTDGTTLDRIGPYTVGHIEEPTNP